MNNTKELVVLRPLLALNLLFSFILSACQIDGSSLASELPNDRLTEKAISTPFPVEATVENSEAETIPTERDEPISYRVQKGDTLSSIAAEFDLQPETLLWANFSKLFDNPDYLLAGLELLILPTDGVYHQVGGADTLTSVAAFFGVEVDAVLGWATNEIDAQNPVIYAGQWLMVPDGRRALRWRMMPNVPRTAASLSPEEFGSGACEDNYAGGALGDGEYSWPLASPVRPSEGFASWHPGVDLAVDNGEWVRAADDGVVVFSGWSNLKYGYLVMIDHGNGEFSLYSGLGGVSAACGSSVVEGDVIGEGGISGYPAGPILHFELRRAADFLNPFDMIPLP